MFHRFKKLQLTAGLCAAGMFAGSASAELFYLDFGATGQPVATGFQAADNTVGFNTVENPVFTLGTVGTLTINGVNNYGFANTSNPLVTDGFFTATTATFDITGLAAGTKVTLYAIEAWDNDARAGYVSLGGNTPVSSATAAADGNGGTLPGTSPTIADFNLIASEVVADLSGTVSGTISVTDGTTTVVEAQIGGFIIETIVPEPASIVLAGLGSLAVLGRRKKA